MKYKNTIMGIFICRPNRFIAHVNIDGKEEKCHVKNTGRCRELLIPGVSVVLEPSQNPERKTKYSLIAVYKGATLINIDSQAPNKAVSESLDMVLGHMDYVKPEYTYKNSRFDFFAQSGDKKYLIEVKGVTLEDGGGVYFPDAPTERGVKHLKELIMAGCDGYLPIVLFVIQMKGVSFFTPNDITHPKFGEMLRKAALSGVKVLAYDCIVTEDEMILDEPVDIRL